MIGSPSGEKGRDDYEGSAHEVTIKNSFYLGKYPVTKKQWEKIMGNNPSHFKGDDLPVECVSWHDVQEFIRKLNEMESTDKYRLPSEAEWEYACRADTTTKYFFGDEGSKLKDYAWYSANSGGKPHPIGQKQPNLLCLYDMHGNVWEWVRTDGIIIIMALLLMAAHGKTETAPIVSLAGKLVLYYRVLLFAGRFRREPESCFANLGFRLVKEL